MIQKETLEVMRSTEVLVREQYEKLAKQLRKDLRKLVMALMFQSMEQMLSREMHKYATVQELPLLM